MSVKKKVENIVDNVILDYNDDLLSLEEIKEMASKNIVMAAMHLSKLPIRDKIRLLEMSIKNELKNTLRDPSKFKELYDYIENKNIAKIIEVLNELSYFDRIDATVILKEMNIIKDVIGFDLKTFVDIQLEKINESGFGYGDLFTDLAVVIKEVGNEVIDYWPKKIKNEISLKMLSSNQTDVDFLESLSLDEDAIIKLTSEFNENELITTLSMKKDLTKESFSRDYFWGIREVFNESVVEEVKKIKKF